MVNISELKVGQGNVDAEGTVTEVGEKRTFNKFGRELTVVNAMLKDDSGSIKLSLWNDDTDRFKEGDKVKVVNGYITEFQGEKQLTSGKFGRIQKAGEGGDENEEEKSEEEKPEEEKSEEEKSEESKEEDSEEESDEEVGDTEDKEEEAEDKEEKESIKEEVF